MPHEKVKEVIQVRATGDWSSDSKLSAIKNGYWTDPYFETFNPNPNVRNRTSLICKGYYVRFKVCDWFIRNIMRTINQKFQIVSLGSGMDTLFFRIISNYSDSLVKFCEVDFPTVIENKLKILQENPELLKMAGETLRLVPGDLRDLPTLQVDLENAGLDPKIPTIFYAECVVNYLKPEENDAILQWIRLNYKLPIWLAYEQCLSWPNNAFGDLMLDHFKKNGCPLLAMEKYTSDKDQLKQLENVFNQGWIINVWSAFLKIVDLEKKAFEPTTNPKHQFDEYEALIGTCLHYTLRISGDLNMCGQINGPLEFFITDNKLDQSDSRALTLGTMNELDKSFQLKLKLCFSGHSSIVRNNKIITIGGTNESSKFITAIYQYQVNIDIEHSEAKDSVVLLDLPYTTNYTSRTNGAAVYSQLSDTIYIFGGRKSPFQPCSNGLIFMNLSSNEINEINSDSGKNCPDCRWRHCMVLMPLPSEQLFIFGGRNAEKTFGDAWVYELSSKLWTEIIPTADNQNPSPRHSHSMSYIPNRNSVFVTGGISADDVTLCLDSCWEYNHNAQSFKKWKELERYTKRAGHNLCSFQNKLIIVGGYPETLSYMSDIVIIELQEDNFNASLYNYKPDLSKSFLPFGIQSQIICNEKNEEFLCVFGGGGNCFSFGSHYNKNMLIIPLSQF